MDARTRSRPAVTCCLVTTLPLSQVQVRWIGAGTGRLMVACTVRCGCCFGRSVGRCGTGLHGAVYLSSRRNGASLGEMIKEMGQCREPLRCSAAS